MNSHLPATVLSGFLGACLIGEARTVTSRRERRRGLPDPFPAWRRAQAA